MKTFLLFAAVLCLPVFAIEDISVETAEYLAKNSTPEADAAWRAKITARIDQMLKDSDALSGPQAAAEKLGFDFFADHKNNFEAKQLSKAEKIETCRMYLFFASKGWGFPSRVDGDITKPKFRVWFIDTGEK